jgi:hypothetical protein
MLFLGGPTAVESMLAWPDIIPGHTLYPGKHGRILMNSMNLQTYLLISANMFLVSMSISEAEKPL